jgi:hypothetical protein
MEVKLHSSSLADLCNEVYDLQITHSPADAAAVGAPGSDRQFPDVVNTFQHDVPLDPARREALACAYRKYAAKFLELLPVAQDRSGPPVMDARGSFTDIANDSPLLTRELSIVVNMHEAVRMRRDLLKHNNYLQTTSREEDDSPYALRKTLTLLWNECRGGVHGLLKRCSICRRECALAMRSPKRFCGQHYDAKSTCLSQGYSEL